MIVITLLLMLFCKILEIRELHLIYNGSKFTLLTRF